MAKTKLQQIGLHLLTRSISNTHHLLLRHGLQSRSGCGDRIWVRFVVVIDRPGRGGRGDGDRGDPGLISSSGRSNGGGRRKLHLRVRGVVTACKKKGKNKK